MKKANKLGSSLSPYLQQHADNPVAWYPWGPEAFADAARKNKPVFLSVGYSACHWCHVMARECFEDEEVAALMNDAFICVKVDREEMPSIDHIYMKVCIMMTGSGGWPLTIIMTPGKEPFFAATYLPKHSRGRAVGMMELIPRITDVWRNQQEKIDRITGRVSEAVREPITRLEVEGPRAQWLQDTYDQLSGMFQGDTGGFGPAPKFPSPHHIMYLLRYHHRNRSDHALSMALKNLDAMRAGGIYDHVGSGFHRYATDALWHIPHFEKMLYDQALLVMAYTEAFLVTGQDSCRRTSTAVIDYVLRDMRSENGLFFSSQDADVQGEEGGYYLWTEQELQSVLSSDDYRVFSRVFAVEPGGNFPEGREKRRNILFMRDTLEDAALELGMDAGNLEEEVERILSVLLQERSTRARPHRDEKILTDWNGLMIAALAKAGAALGIPEYVRAAEQAAVFILENLSDDQGRLMHLYRGGRTAHRAGLDDYAFLVWGLIELYEATFRMIHLDEALRLTRECISLFWDERKGAFFLTPNDAETVMVRPLEFTDNAVPSGNSVSLYNLVRLAHLTGDMSLEDRGAAIARACSHQISSMPAAESFMMIGVDFLLGPPYEIVIAGNPAQDDTVRMIGALAARFIPDSVIVLAAKGESGKAPEIARDKKPLDGKAAAYVCRGQTCTLPMTDPNEVLNILAPQG
jgi:uncharacterized protein YyaL (SSP411 family)